MVNTKQNDAMVFALSISEVRGVKKHNVREAIFVEDYGIQNDAHAGKWHRQVSLLALESIERFNSASGLKVSPGEFAENITTKGVNLLSLPIGSTIKIGNDVVLLITQHGKECHTNCEIFKLVGKCVMPTEGIFAKVLKGGIVKVGDRIQTNVGVTIREQSLEQ